MPVIDLSIILPVYNAEAQIEQCLESILYSGYPVNTELIIVDDASVDDTFKIIERFVSAPRTNFSNILLERNKQNLGVATSRNLGLDISSGTSVVLNPKALKT